MTSVVDRVTGTRPPLPPPSDLTALSAGVLASLVARREVSAREIVQAHIRRIEDVDRRLNAVIFRRFDRALDEADETDAGLRRGAAPRPLTGVPITVKDQFLVADTPTTLGLPSRASHRASSDGPSIRRLRAAGAIVLGKTNVGQLLMYHESVNPLFGRTNNPWDPDRTPGGSSGGEAAIIAAGGSPLGLGGDFRRQHSHPGTLLRHRGAAPDQPTTVPPGHAERLLLRSGPHLVSARAHGSPRVGPDPRHGRPHLRRIRPD